MSKELDHRKYKVIEEIVKLEDENLLSAIEEQLEEAKATYSNKQQNEEREKHCYFLQNKHRS